MHSSWEPAESAECSKWSLILGLILEISKSPRANPVFQAGDQSDNFSEQQLHLRIRVEFGFSETKSSHRLLKWSPVSIQKFASQPANYIIVSHSELEKVFQTISQSIKNVRKSSLLSGQAEDLIRWGPCRKNYIISFSFGKNHRWVFMNFWSPIIQFHKPTQLSTFPVSHWDLRHRSLGGVTYFYRNISQAFNFQTWSCWGYPFFQTMSHTLNFGSWEVSNSPQIGHKGRIPAQEFATASRLLE